MVGRNLKIAFAKAPCRDIPNFCFGELGGHGIIHGIWYKRWASPRPGFIGLALLQMLGLSEASRGGALRWLGIINIEPLRGQNGGIGRVVLCV